MAWLAAQQADSTSQQTQQGYQDLGNRVSSGEIAKSWNKTVWEPIVFTPMQTRWTAAIESRTTTLTQSFDSKFERSRQQIQTSIRAQFGDLTEIKLGNFEKQLAENTKAVTALQGTATNLGNRVREQEQVNAQANTQLAGIQTGLQNLTTAISNTISPTLADVQTRVANIPIDIPTTATVGGLVVGTMISSVPLTRMLTDTSAAGTCRTTQPGGCLNTQLQNLGNGIKQHAGDIANGALNTAQMVLLKQIDAKLGAQIVGGIGGKLVNFVNWAVVDRVMNLVTMMASIHNVTMLSNSIGSTFFSILDNALQAGYNVAPTLFKNVDGDGAVDSREFVTSKLNSYMSSLLGATEWAALKAQWKAYSTIYNSTGQVFNNLRELHNDAQELMNMNKNYTAELGNALVDEGVISEDKWEYKNEKEKIKSSKLNALSGGLSNLDQRLQAIETVTATVLNITNTAREIQENIQQIQSAVTEANKAAKDDRNAKVEGLELPNFSLDDIF